MSINPAKILPGFVIEPTTIAVDYWATKKCLTHFFLTHAHTDHMKNLTSKWNGPKIYCSKLTKKLLVNLKNIDEDLIIGLEYEKKYEMTYGDQETFDVTLISANHCPGAVMILFEFQNDLGNILATGDFRYNPDMFNPLSVLNNIDIDLCYFDNSYFHPKYSNIPSKKKATEELIILIHIKLKQYNFNVVFQIEMYNLGKESLIVTLCEHFNKNCLISSNRFDRYTNIFKIDEKHFTTKYNKNTLFYIKDKKDKFDENLKDKKIIKINPSARNLNRSKDMNRKELIEMFEKSNSNYFQIPYSDHSSYIEILNFMRKLRPKEILPTVNTPEDFGIKKYKFEKLYNTLGIQKNEFSCEECNRWWFDYERTSKCFSCDGLYKAIPKKEQFGFCLFSCDCGNQFSGFASKKNLSICYNCLDEIYPEKVNENQRFIQRKSKNSHYCSACNGEGKCSIYNKVLYPSEKIV